MVGLHYPRDDNAVNRLEKMMRERSSSFPSDVLTFERLLKWRDGRKRVPGRRPKSKDPICDGMYALLLALKLRGFVSNINTIRRYDTLT